MSWLSKTFGGGSDNYTNPADVAMPYLEQVPGQVDKYYNPYIEMGTTAGNVAQPQYAKMASDPSAFMNELMKDYDESEWEQYQEDKLTDEAAADAAMGGYTGTDQDIQNQSELVQGLSSKDMQQWINTVLGILNGGLSGEQEMYNIGYGASNSAADANISNLNAEAGLSYKGQENENAYNASQTNGFLKALGDVGGAALYYGLS